MQVGIRVPPTEKGGPMKQENANYVEKRGAHAAWD